MVIIMLVLLILQTQPYENDLGPRVHADFFFCEESKEDTKSMQNL